MASGQLREELENKAREGETVVPGGTGGKSLEAQEHLAEGRSKGGQTRKEQLGTQGYKELRSKGGQTGRSRLGRKGARRWGAKVGSAPWTSLEVSVLKKKAFTSTNPSSENLPEV